MTDAAINMNIGSALHMVTHAKPVKRKTTLQKCVEQTVREKHKKCMQLNRLRNVMMKMTCLYYVGTMKKRNAEDTEDAHSDSSSWT